MTALSEDTSRAECTTPRQKFFPARALNQDGDPIVFYKGAIVCKRKDSKLVEIPEAANPRTDLIPLGVCECPIDMTGLSDGDRNVTVNPGLLRAFQTGADANEITADHIGQTWYMYDDTTAYLTDDGGTLSPGGTIGMVEADEVDGETALALYFDCESPQVLLAIAEQSGTVGDLSALSTTEQGSIVGAINEVYDFAVAAPSIQAVDATLVAGTVTINAGITVAAGSEVVPLMIGALAGSTNFGSLGELKASRVNGAPGVGTVVIQAYGNDGALDADAAGAIRVVILTPQI